MEEYFKPSDIVWVKLGPFWWPGEVVDKTKVPEEVTESLKKEPVAIVKFFDDDEYFECVKTPDYIFHYNCERKNGFIKKGMDAFRAKNPKLASFPKDVSTAEVKTGGSANILSDPMFTPQLKRNYSEDTFGSSSPKKLKNSNKKSPKKSAPIITHRRFLGYDDYESRVLIQNPGKDKELSEEDQTDLNSEETFAKFTCPICQFVTDKLDILTVHTQCHVEDMVHIPRMKKTPKRKRKKGMSDEELYGDDKKTKTKRKYKKKADQSSFADDERSGNDTFSTEDDILKHKIEHSTCLEKKDVCNDIIADWDDESNLDTTEEIDASLLDSTINETDTSLEITVNEASTTADSALDSTFDLTEEDVPDASLLSEAKDQPECLEKTEKEKPTEETKPEEKKEKDANISCFDFDENEEDTRIPNATSGRKIPRVIPLSDKRKSFNFEDDLVEEEEEAIRKKILNESVQLGKVNEIEAIDKETEDLEKTYKSLMDATSKIELPEVPSILKSEQNFHCAKTVKYPDKSVEENSNVTDGEIVAGNSQSIIETNENLEISEGVDFAQNIEKCIENSEQSKVLEDVILSVEEQCENMSENLQSILSVGSITDVMPDDKLKDSEVENEPSVVKKNSKKLEEHEEATIEDKCKSTLVDVLDDHSLTSSSKKKSRKTREYPEHSVSEEEVTGSRKKRSRKSKVGLEDVEKKLAEKMKYVEASPVTEITESITLIDQKSSEKLNDPPKIEETESEKIEIIEDYNKKSKIKLKKEISKSKKEKKEKQSTPKRHIDESEIDKLLAKYSVEPIRDDEESDCPVESVTVHEVFRDSSATPLSEYPEKDSSAKSVEIEQHVSETKAASHDESDLINSSEKKVEIDPEQQTSTIEKSDTHKSEQSEVNLKEYKFETPAQPSGVDSTNDSNTSELVVEERVEIVPSIDHLTSDVSSEQTATQVDLKKENKKKSVSSREKSSRRSTKRHKSTSSYNQQEDHAVTSTIVSESKKDVDANEFEENKDKDQRRDCSARLSASIDCLQVSEVCKEDSTTVQQETQEISANASLSSSEASALVVADGGEPRHSKKKDRKSSKDNKKETSHSRSSSNGKKETEATVSSSRRSTRWDRNSTSREDIISLQSLTADNKSKSESEIIDSNTSKRDDSKGSSKEKKIEKTDPQQSRATAGDQVSLSSSKNSKKSDKNDKEERHISKNESLGNAEPNLSERKESHKSPHKSSKSYKRSSKSSRETHSSSKKHDIIQDVTPTIDQIPESVESNRSSRSKSNSTEQDTCNKHEQKEEDEIFQSTKSNKGDHHVLESEKQKEKKTVTSPKDRKISQGSRSNRRSSKRDQDHQESSKESCNTRIEHSKIDDKKDISSVHRRSKIEKCSDKDVGKSSNSSRVIRNDVIEEKSLEVTQGSSSHRTYRRSKDHSEKHKNDSLQSNKVTLNEKELKASTFRCYKNDSSLKKDRQEKLKHATMSEETEKKIESHSSNRKDDRSEVISTEIQNDSKTIESEKIISYSDKIDEELIRVDEISSNCGIEHLDESKLDKEKEAASKISELDQEKYGLLQSIDHETECADNAQKNLNEKQDKSDVTVCQESPNEKIIEPNIVSSPRDHDINLKITTQGNDVQLDEIIFDEKPSCSDIRSDERNSEISFAKNQTSIESNSFSPISCGDQDLTNLISAIVGADSTHQLDQIEKSGRADGSCYPTPGSSDIQILCCEETKDKVDSSDRMCHPTSVSESIQKVDIETTANVVPPTTSCDTAETNEGHKQELSASQTSRRNRKPSRWDQKERPNTNVDKKPRISRWDQGNHEYISEQKSNISEIIEKLEIMNSIEKSPNVPYSESDLNSPNEQLDNKLLAQSEEPSVVSLREAEQIELIFGSSPLPKPNEDNLFTEEDDKKLQEVDSNEFVHKKDPKKFFMMKAKLSESDTISEEKNEETSIAFECSSIHLPLDSSTDDLMESVESQVARITHYEEPNSEEKLVQGSNEYREQSKKESIFDTPEKEKKICNSIFDTPDDKVKLDSETPESKLQIEKKRPRLLETDLGMYKSETIEAQPMEEQSVPKSKKNYLLVEKSKLEKMEESAEPSKDPPLPSPSFSSKSTTEKTVVNEVATKLTNPKKRFVKSFKDFELNKQKEKSVDVCTPDENKQTKTSTVSGLVGKSPIVFKLKKQFLSKISNVFDEVNEDISKGNLSSIKSKPFTSVPSKVKELNLLSKGEDKMKGDDKMKVEDKMKVSEGETIKSVPKIETGVKEEKTPVISDEVSSPENVKTTLSESLLQDPHKQEELELEPVSHLEIKTDTPENEKPNVSEQISTLKSSSHQVHFTADNVSPIEFTIDTNLSNIDKPEGLSELAVLVDIPELQSDVAKTVEEEAHVDDSKTEIITKNFPLENAKEEPEFVPIDKNLTVVSEKELEEGQVEIMASMSNKKPMSLMNFSMDFSDDSSDTSFEVLKKENIRSITDSLDVNKSSEDEFKDQVGDDTKQHQLTENTSSELAATSKDIEDTFQSTIIAQLDLNFDSHTSVREGDHRDITIENILETKDTKKDEAAKIMASNDAVPKDNETTTFTKSECRVSDVVSTKEPDKVESHPPVKRSERKASQKNKLITPPGNEPVVIYNTVKSSTITDMCDLEDHIPSQIVCTKNALINEEVMKVAGIGNELSKEGSLQKIEPPISKLLSRLSGEKMKEEAPAMKTAEIETKKKEIDTKNLKLESSHAKNVTKPTIKGKNSPLQTLSGVSSAKSGNKAIILSEKIIRPARDVPSNQPMKRSYEDVEDIKPYIISKNQKIDNKKGQDKPITTVSKLTSASTMKSPTTTSKFFLTNPNKQTIGVPKFSGKAKILNQTIIRPAGEIQQSKAVSSVEDNVDFDINSMPIVISDELLTPESLENMPIVLGDNIPKTSATEKLKIVVEKKEPHSTAKSLNNSVTMPSLLHSPTIKMPQLKKTIPKILQTPGQSQKIIRQASTKPGKYIILPENPNKSAQMMKKPNIVRRSMPISGVAVSSQNLSPETTGHKIMIVTNQQGQQQRLLLTPAHQKMFGMQLPKAGKAVVKSAVAQKTPIGKVQTTSPSTFISGSKVQGISSPKFIKAPLSSGQVVSPQLKLAPPRKVQKVYMPSQQTTKVPQQKTILIRNQHGQTVRKIQGTDDALLDKQVAEQLEAIKVSSLKSQQRQQELTIKATSANKPSAISTRKAYSKRPEFKQSVIAQPKLSVQSTANVPNLSKQPEQSIPPLTPIKLDKKSEETQRQLPEVKQADNKPLDRPLNQLVIQDNMGNQTTVTEGQILALPSETVDGQPQSYMLVTLDETGNLTPLNNEALMSLDPSLAGLTGGDLSNMVLQLDPGITKDGGSHTAQLQAIAPLSHVQEKLKPAEAETPKIVRQEVPPKPPVEQVLQPVEQGTAQVQVTCNINGEPSQQIILTGDPLATQKFLDSLSEGNTDLANILANAEGSSFLIQADGQQILINTEPTDAQMLHANTSVAEQPEQGNPVFATHHIKNQDILAAALADTDVFQQEQVSSQNKIMHSQLSPGQTLFPMNVGNVLETSLTLNSPIMTPLEVPSTNSKKITDAEADILSARVPKNIDLPITITDPNISQTVSHQQALIASDLQSKLELTLPISETAMSVTSGMNSPSFVYSLPSLDVAEHTEVSQKSFSSSMPLLTEDIEEPSLPPPAVISKEGDELIDNKLAVEEVPKHSLVESLSDRRPGVITSDGTFIEEGLCTLGGEMCSSLSEPPPEMFDIPISNDGLNFLSHKAESDCKENSNTSIGLPPELLTDDNSMEIPVQPQIVADLKDPPHMEDSLNSTTEEKECKLD